ncbi:hypothetical protein BOTBODRAFT_343572 [Botryobasidium botryosum FD-172 SS1]|uniref:Uncharacterized protein n=1 Tax=Botryobasidium botryosum (strain FD-172 SS1) TaxID=930990 RepID=A0A067MFD3_BOTB1|nr:hypothetical protein BOTBODRAFT_343572 [Botryobasidium botryosum FD-172 SS1]
MPLWALSLHFVQRVMGWFCEKVPGISKPQLPSTTPQPSVEDNTATMQSCEDARRNDRTPPAQLSEAATVDDDSAHTGHLVGKSQSNIEFTPLTIPHALPDIPPRPEFTPFTVPRVCAPAPYDHLDFWTYPERHGWIVHSAGRACHILCPPGYCRVLKEAGAKRESRPAIFSRADGSPVRASDKVAFLQAWLFFGLLEKVSTLCGLEIDVDKEFLVENGESVSTARLNGLSERWFDALRHTSRLGETALMEQILALGRHARLILAEEHIDGAVKKQFGYTYSECRILQSLDIVVRVIGLHLLSHVNLEGFDAAPGEGWGKQRITTSLLNPIPLKGEGIAQLERFAEEELEERGWCPSEIYQLPAVGMEPFAALLERPKMRDHANCGEKICAAYQTDEATYKTVHVYSDCECGFVAVKTDELVDALAADKIPKVIVSEQLELRVVTDDDSPYVAMSHVSSMRSPNANSSAYAPT